ncbi:MAG: M28 family peptidase [Ignavibacteriales bacterium]|nr:M28 family peptidase [Ignavibacteriales bacterium]
MKKLLLCIACGTFVAFSQKPPQKNSLVEKVVSEISAKNIRAIVEKIAAFDTRHTLSDTLSDTRGIGAARRWIKSEFEKYADMSEGRMLVEFFETIVPPSNRVPSPAKIVNVVATLSPEPTHHPMPDRVLVVSGHYDSRASNPLDSVSAAPGANDDGSGTAVVLELARVMSKYRFDATVVFMAVAGEEQGLLGSAAWAEMAKQKGWNVEAVLNNDIVGNSKGGDGTRENKYVRVFSEAFSPLDTGSVFRQRISLGHENDGGSRTLARYVKETGELYQKSFGVRMVYRLDRFLRGGDHRPFHERGFRAVRFSEVKENYDHQHQDVRIEGGKEYGDLPKFMDFEYCAKVAKVNGAALASLAWGPAPPSKVGLVTRQLGYETTLCWNKNKEPDIEGYVVRYRKTSDPTWQSAVFTKDTTLTLRVSKDEHLFGVQAVDMEGNRSLVTLPTPVR